MTAYFYPEPMARILRLALEEVLGGDRLDSIPQFARLPAAADPPAAPEAKTSPFEQLAQVQPALEQAFGVQAGRGVAWRVGRACFQHGLRQYGPSLGVTQTGFRLLPFSARLQRGAELLADLFNRQSDQHVRLEQHPGRLFWHIQRCPLCWGRQVDEPACSLAVGLLQESLHWLSGGKIFTVEEVACIGRGDPACTIVIDPTPIA